MTLYTHQSANIRRTWMIMIVFFVIVIALGWFVSYYYNNPGILYIAVIFSIVMNIGSYWFSDKIVIALTGAKPVQKSDNPELWNVLENLSITAGLPMPKLYIVNDTVPNAFATGRNKEHAVVAVTTGLLGLLDRNELEGVIAHELSHIGNRDMLVSTVAVVLVGFISLLADFFLRSGLMGGGRRDNDRGGGNILAVVGIIFVILSPIIAKLMQLAISRKREFLADASGALLTRYPEGLASALEKIHGHGGEMRKAHSATAHLFIANPFGPEKSRTSWLVRIFSTHPPVGERIKALRGEHAETP
jgi:heat shock protein HtpX